MSTKQTLEALEERIAALEAKMTTVIAAVPVPGMAGLTIIGGTTRYFPWSDLGLSSMPTSLIVDWEQGGHIDRMTFTAKHLAIRTLDGRSVIRAALAIL